MYIAEPSPAARHMGCPSTQPACDRAAATVLGLARVPSPSHITSYSRRSIPSATTRSNISLLVLLLSGDIAPNPGPAARDIYPCGHCELPVNWSDQAVLCDSCEIWFHRSCHSMSATEYANLQSDISWKCYRCNHPISNTYHSYELHDSSLDHSSDTSTILRGRFYSASSLPSPGSAFSPQSHSTPEAQQSSKSDSIRSSSVSSTDYPLPNKNRNWRTLVINANSVISESKRAELSNLVDYTKPDAIIMTETKLCPAISSSEFMPPGYSKPLRNDFKKGARGVLIAVKSCYNLTAVNLPTDSQDIVWGEVSLRNMKKLFIGAFYRTPSGKPDNQLSDLETSIKELKKITRNRRDSTIILGGDFNFGDIDWESESVREGSSNAAASQRLLDILNDNQLSQLQRESTRKDRLLDLYITNRPTLVKTITMVPSISDHDGAIVADSDIIPAYNKKKPRKLFVWSQAKWSKIKEDVSFFTENFLNTYNDFSVNENWNRIKCCINDSLTYHVPVKISSGKQSNSWITPELRRKSRKKHRLSRKAKRTGDPARWKQFKEVQKSNKRAITKARVKYINEQVVGDLEGGNAKPFWRYIKSLRQDSFGIPALRVGAQLFTSAQDKAKVLLDEFKSVFTIEDTSFIPWLGRSTSKIPDLTVGVSGVRKLL